MTAFNGLGTLATQYGHDAPEVPGWPHGADPALVIEAAPHDECSLLLVRRLWLLWTVATLQPTAGQLTLPEVMG